jgi:hypothetical protein
MIELGRQALSSSRSWNDRRAVDRAITGISDRNRARHGNNVRVVVRIDLDQLPSMGLTSLRNPVRRLIRC